MSASESKKNTSEEKIKHKIFNEFFENCDYNPDNSKIDLEIRYDDYPFIWAEVKNKPTDVDVMFAQLVFTAYKVQKYQELPPFFAVYDTEKIAFIPSSAIEILYNEQKHADFNWNVRPSDTSTKEFKTISAIIKRDIDDKYYIFDKEKSFDFQEHIFYYNNDEDKQKLKDWIKVNIYFAEPSAPKRIDDNNFYKVFNRWVEVIKPTINADWDAIKAEYALLDSDFFLADLMSTENETTTINDKLHILLKSDYYKIQKESQDARLGIHTEFKVRFNDNQAKHKRFWEGYKRPPEEEYWDIILRRRDMLVPFDIRERLGAFFTPPMWVKLSQEYMADCWGDLSDYYIWDCAGGTGNLLEGLTNKRNLFVSDINIENVYITHGRIAQGNLNLFEGNVFQFDFLNDDPYGLGISYIDKKNPKKNYTSKLPSALQKIISDPDKRKKLIIYMNPPYKEAMNKKIPTMGHKNVNKTDTYQTHLKKIGKAGRELFIQFLIRIHEEINGCKIGTFSTLKGISAPNFDYFREFFQAKFLKGFLIPAWTFDNVNGNFPIGFQCWNTAIKEQIKTSKFDVYSVKMEKGVVLFKEIKEIKKEKPKMVYVYDKNTLINDWIKEFVDESNNEELCAMCCIGNDIQHRNYVNINIKEKLQGVGNAKGIAKLIITKDNIIPACIYYSVRKVIKPTWLNDRDQFLYPNDGWKKDKEFQSNCLAYTLFHSSNNIQCKYGTNHWIPFTEEEVGAKKTFDSNFMTEFIAGKIKINNGNGIFIEETTPAPPQEGNFKYCHNSPPLEGGNLIEYDFRKQSKVGVVKIEFSKEATEVLAAGRELWKYYHTQFFDDVNYDINASLYDIKLYFQGKNEKTGRMNSGSKDDKYNDLLENLKLTLEKLSEKIIPKIYEHGFLLVTDVD